MKSILLAASAMAALAASAPALAQHDGHAPAPPPPPAQGAPPQAPPVDHGAHALPGARPAGTDHEMTGALGPYPTSREASGTAWQPDASRHGGVHVDGRRLDADGPCSRSTRSMTGSRGRAAARRASSPGMVDGHGAARRRRRGTLQLRAMLSPDPLMGRRGYPLHLAAGETRRRRHAAGRPPASARFLHGAVGELQPSPVGPTPALFLYAGLPGEPAFGPPAFMHRMSIMDSPEAPITHHWLDSTHITFGVVTAGLVVGDVKLEGSRFNGREPDQRRCDIETGPLDSTALRLSWNPTPQPVAAGELGASRRPRAARAGREFDPLVGERDLHAAASARTTGGRRPSPGAIATAPTPSSLESAAGLGLWTLFGRAEYAENDELTSPAAITARAFKVGKVSLGAIRDFRVAPNVRLGLGAPLCVELRARARSKPLYARRPGRRDGLHPPADRLSEQTE